MKYYQDCTETSVIRFNLRRIGLLALMWVATSNGLIPPNYELRGWLCQLA